MISVVWNRICRSLIVFSVRLVEVRFVDWIQSIRQYVIRRVWRLEILRWKHASDIVAGRWSPTVPDRFRSLGNQPQVSAKESAILTVVGVKYTCTSWNIDFITSAREVFVARWWATGQSRARWAILPDVWQPGESGHSTAGSEFRDSPAARHTNKAGLVLMLIVKWPGNMNCTCSGLTEGVPETFDSFRSKSGRRSEGGAWG